MGSDYDSRAGGVWWENVFELILVKGLWCYG